MNYELMQMARAYELEASIPQSDRGAYIRELCRVCGFSHRKPILWDLAHATPDQRIRAWLSYIREHATK